MTNFILLYFTTDIEKTHNEAVGLFVVGLGLRWNLRGFLTLLALQKLTVLLAQIGRSFLPSENRTDLAESQQQMTDGFELVVDLETCESAVEPDPDTIVDIGRRLRAGLFERHFMAQADLFDCVVVVLAALLQACDAFVAAFFCSFDVPTLSEREEVAASGSDKHRDAGFDFTA